MSNRSRDADVAAVVAAWNAACDLFDSRNPHAPDDARHEFAARRTLDCLQHDRGWRRPGTDDLLDATEVVGYVRLDPETVREVEDYQAALRREVGE
jgi:hypothetical protein